MYTIQVHYRWNCIYPVQVHKNILYMVQLIYQIQKLQTKFGRLSNEHRCFYIFESFVVCLISDERDAVQKKTFTKWVNKHLLKVCKLANKNKTTGLNSQCFCSVKFLHVTLSQIKLKSVTFTLAVDKQSQYAEAGLDLIVNNLLFCWSVSRRNADVSVCKYLS